MNDDIENLIAMLRTNLEGAVTSTLGLLDELGDDLAGAADNGDTSQTVLLDAIKAQIGMAMAEVERFDSTVGSQIKIARAYADSLTK